MAAILVVKLFEKTQLFRAQCVLVRKLRVVDTPVRRNRTEADVGFVFFLNRQKKLEVFDSRGFLCQHTGKSDFLLLFAQKLESLHDVLETAFAAIFVIESLKAVKADQNIIGLVDEVLVLRMVDPFTVGVDHQIAVPFREPIFQMHSVLVQEGFSTGENEKPAADRIDLIQKGFEFLEMKCFVELVRVTVFAGKIAAVVQSQNDDEGVASAAQPSENQLEE